MDPTRIIEGVITPTWERLLGGSLLRPRGQRSAFEAAVKLLPIIEEHLLPDIAHGFPREFGGIMTPDLGMMEKRLGLLKRLGIKTEILGRGQFKGVAKIEAPGFDPFVLAVSKERMQGSSFGSALGDIGILSGARGIEGIPEILTTGKNRFMFAMEHIKGKSLDALMVDDTLTGPEAWRAAHEASYAATRVGRKTGHWTFDLQGGNIMLDKSTGKSTLVDVGFGHTGILQASGTYIPPPDIDLAEEAFRISPNLYLRYFEGHGKLPGGSVRKFEQNFQRIMSSPTDIAMKSPTHIEKLFGPYASMQKDEPFVRTKYAGVAEQIANLMETKQPKQIAEIVADLNDAGKSIVSRVLGINPNEIQSLGHGPMSEISAREAESTLGADLGSLTRVPLVERLSFAKGLWKWAVKPARTVEEIAEKFEQAGTFAFISHARSQEAALMNIVRGHLPTSEELSLTKELDAPGGLNFLSFSWGFIRSGYSARDVGNWRMALEGGGTAHLLPGKALTTAGKVNSYRAFGEPFKVRKWLGQTTEAELQQTFTPLKVIGQPGSTLSRKELRSEQFFMDKELNVRGRGEQRVFDETGELITGEDWRKERIRVLPRTSLEHGGFLLSERGARRKLFEMVVPDESWGAKKLAGRGIDSRAQRIEWARNEAAKVIEYEGTTATPMVTREGEITRLDPQTLAIAISGGEKEYNKIFTEMATTIHPSLRGELSERVPNYIVAPWSKELMYAEPAERRKMIMNVVDKVSEVTKTGFWEQTHSGMGVTYTKKAHIDPIRVEMALDEREFKRLSIAEPRATAEDIIHDLGLFSERTKIKNDAMVDVMHVYAGMAQYPEEVPVLFQRAADDANLIAREHAQQLGIPMEEIRTIPPKGTGAAQQLKIEKELNSGPIGSVLPPGRAVFDEIFGARAAAAFRRLAEGHVVEGASEAASHLGTKTTIGRRLTEELSSALMPALPEVNTYVPRMISDSGLSSIAHNRELDEHTAALAFRKQRIPEWGIAEPEESPMRQLRREDNLSGGAWNRIRSGDHQTLDLYPASSPHTQSLIESTSGIRARTADIMEGTTLAEERRLGQLTQEDMQAAFDERALDIAQAGEPIPDPMGMNPFSEQPIFHHTIRVEGHGSRPQRAGKRLRGTTIDAEMEAGMSTQFTYNEGTINVAKTRDTLRNLYAIG